VVNDENKNTTPLNSKMCRQCSDMAHQVSILQHQFQALSERMSQLQVVSVLKNSQ